MGRFIASGSIVAGLPADASQRIIAEVEAKALIAVPCLDSVTDPSALAAISSVLVRIAGEWVRETGKIASQTSGPWSVSFVKSAIVAGSFSASDLAWMRRLAGCDQTTVAGPVGSFPPSPNLDHLFAERRRRHGR